MAELETVKKVDVARYMGVWYEIARMPLRSENNLVGITATYSLMPNGKVKVVNKGFVKDLDGKPRSAQAKAWVVDTTTNAKLKVQFFWPFSADYWILALGENYEYAMVGNESHRYLWILSRTPQMDEGIYNGLIDSARQKGFDVDQLVKCPQRVPSNDR
jgi:apolipoprotein D and lipocalin family protein